MRYYIWKLKRSPKAKPGKGRSLPPIGVIPMDGPAHPIAVGTLGEAEALAQQLADQLNASVMILQGDHMSWAKPQRVMP